ncbi:MAG: hypothetical protein ABI422_00080 [Sphingomicrobium sp.]
MADVLRLAPCLLFVLLIAVAAVPAAAEPRMPGLKLQSDETGIFDRLARSRQAPVLGPVLGRRFLEEEATPAWTPPFGPSANERAEERGRRGLRFSVRPSHGLKAMARLRF